MRLPAPYALTATLAFASLGSAKTVAAYDTALVGTWSSKSNKTLTGPGFFNPVTDTLIEPTLPGISYSFTDDGWFEEAYYRAISNPSDPSCPSGIMQWQHGTYVIYTDGSMSLTPIAVDGRQLLSEPCTYDNAIYTRYNQTETIASYQVLLDPYHNIQRLNLFEFNGVEQIPLYLVYSPPVMLPTQTLNPTASGAGATATSKAKAKRGLEVPINYKMGSRKGVDAMNPDRWWWVGLGMTGVGGLLYFGPRRMGVHL